jgi:hypothetical protein
MYYLLHNYAVIVSAAGAFMLQNNRKARCSSLNPDTAKTAHKVAVVTHAARL